MGLKPIIFEKLEVHILRIMAPEVQGTRISRSGGQDVQGLRRVGSVQSSME